MHYTHVRILTLLALLSSPAGIASGRKRATPCNHIVPLVLVTCPLPGAQAQAPHRSQTEISAPPATLQARLEQPAVAMSAEQQLIQAAHNGDIETMRQLLKDKKVNIHAENNEALHQALLSEGGEHGEMVTLLLDHGALWPKTNPAAAKKAHHNQ